MMPMINAGRVTSTSVLNRAVQRCMKCSLGWQNADCNQYVSTQVSSIVRRPPAYRVVHRSGLEIHKSGSFKERQLSTDSCRTCATPRTGSSCQELHLPRLTFARHG